MRELPILCNTQVVQNILAGSQTQDRRPIKPQPPKEVKYLQKVAKEFIEAYPNGALNHGYRVTPKYQPGDLLYVKETFYHIEQELEYVDVGCGASVPVAELCAEKIIYRADEPELLLKWKPSIHMPKWAARIWLEVTKVRVERIQDIIDWVFVYDFERIQK